MATKKSPSRSTSASKSALSTSPGPKPTTAAPGSRGNSATKRKVSALPANKSVSQANLEVEGVERVGSKAGLGVTEETANVTNVEGEGEKNGKPTVVVPQVDEKAEFSKRVEALPLPFEVLRTGLSMLGRAPRELRMVFGKLSLPNAGFNQLDMLRNYPFLHTLELPGNGITDVSVLGTLRYLTHLDLSNNKLPSALAFHPPPHNLQFADLSKNQITTIPDLSPHRFLRTLCLDRNMICNIGSGLQHCAHLTHLSLVNNGIVEIEGLEGLPLQYLDLRWNRISRLEGLEGLAELEELRVGFNDITELRVLKGLLALRKVDVEGNAIGGLEESMAALEELVHLREVHLGDNPISRVGSSRETNMSTAAAAPASLPSHPPDADYRLRIVFRLPRLTVLDGLPVTAEEKTAAINMFSPPPPMVASVQHAEMLKNYVLPRMVTIGKVELMRARRLRPVVICGSKGVGKRSLAQRLTTTHPDIYTLIPSHTTRPPRPHETDGVEYHFTSKADMQAVIEQGRFVQVAVLFGEMYGVCEDVLDRATESGRIGVLCMELDGVLSLKRSPIKCHYINVSAPDIATLQSRLHALHGSPADIPASTPSHSSPTPGSFSQTRLSDADGSHQQLIPIAQSDSHAMHIVGPTQNPPSRGSTSGRSDVAGGDDNTSTTNNNEETDETDAITMASSGSSRHVSGPRTASPSVASSISRRESAQSPPIRRDPSTPSEVADEQSDSGVQDGGDEGQIGQAGAAPHLTPRSLTHRWLVKAALTKAHVDKYAGLEGKGQEKFFDLRIVNEDMDAAYAELESFCLREWEKVRDLEE
ncbi:uncharacterized protein EV422DRAFT_507299 [Fimicolochytrium jonesii]|uniref:uncharacterized protein n=1 Tax=Fimicolochytrium jonesii TaxID=1396493 RepID=UPI0022FEF775|nr:uncharacterized protein EV422DRAFT_507299 [Fimicolochytrium jonesii]KAI8819666.1 hypothetical protein EV422DRAFT_507299 [Fimicolochytrium jonesii]